MMKDKIKPENWLLKVIILTWTMSMFAFFTSAQKSLTRLENERGIDSLYTLARKYFFNDLDSCSFFLEKSIASSKEINYQYGLARGIQNMGEIKRVRGDLVGSVEDQLEALRIFKEIGDKDGECTGYAFLGFSYAEGLDGTTALRFLKKARDIHLKELVTLDRLKLTVPSFLYSNLGFAYFILGELDSAERYQDLAFTLIYNTQEPVPVKNIIFRRLASIEFSRGQYDSSISYLKRAIENNILVGNKNHWDIPVCHASIAKAFLEKQDLDSALWYSYLAISGAEKVNRKLGLLEACELLSKIFKMKGKTDSAFYYLEKSSALKDEIFGVEKLNKLALLLTDQLEQQQKKQQLESENRLVLERARFRLWILVAMLSVLVLAILLFFFNKNRKTALKSKWSIEKAYDQLKSTQAQLIQAEKMASFGELTAGIAHEIQNPLNFVNNFTEVSNELIDEMNEELDKGDIKEAKVLASDVKQNLEKILQHGKRADSIVKGMLQHSRKSSGIKEPTDINALADEYLRLTYHGLKAKDKSFNTTMKSDFDPSIGKINVTPQEMGRVLMNLLNNAFYAVNEKRKLNINGYEPNVTISTQKLKDKVEIKVRDNGNGIPQALLDKIFQPFFTTKPSGEGTGLGLSLSYEIVTKGHGGELTVDTKEGEYTTFRINLPL